MCVDDVLAEYLLVEAKRSGCRLAGTFDMLRTRGFLAIYNWCIRVGDHSICHSVGNIPKDMLFYVNIAVLECAAIRPHVEGRGGMIRRGDELVASSTCASITIIYRRNDAADNGECEVEELVYIRMPERLMKEKGVLHMHV